MTNLLHLFGSSAAWKAVALPLMLTDANHYAERLDLPMSRPVEEAHLVEQYVGAPRFGVNGSIRITNIAFTFWEGRLHTITRMDILHGAEPLRLVFDRLSRQPSVVDSNGAYQLASQWLRAISINVPVLEKAYAPQICQRWYYGQAYAVGLTPPPKASRILLPIFDVKWGNPHRPEFERAAIEVAVLGHSRELLDLQIADPSFLARPPLTAGRTEATNPSPASVPTPTKADDVWRRPRWAPPSNLPAAEWVPWMEQCFRAENVQTLKRPLRVEAYLIKTPDRLGVYKQADQFPVRRGPVSVPPEVARRMARLILALDSYEWRVQPFSPDYMARVRFEGRTNAVDVVFAFNGDALCLYNPDGRTPELCFRPARQKFLGLFNEIFPKAREFRRFDPE